MAKKKQLERPAPPQPFSLGEELACRYKPLLFDVIQPCVVLEMKPGGMSGWMVGVDTTKGVQMLDSEYFRKP